MPQFSPLPSDYSDRVYGGVLGKVIGVYLGRPFEQWSHQRIVERFGEINFYVNKEVGVPIVVADDDISGTFTFLRALEDNDFDPNLTAEQIGETWLNYIIEDRTILWWGGRSTSTEHTAFLNLKNGIKAPRSGSIELNGKTVAEQIGSQIFIDGWGLIHPNDPEAAADWARRAASVSHDGEAIYGAQVIAAMVAGAFGEQDLNKLQDLALAQIPPDCQIRRLVEDVRELVARYPDWKEGFAELDRTYGYGVYTSNCHIIPNHGLIHFALLHGKGDFQHSMRVVNTCGWDTDCNAGNVGCILGVIDGYETLGPADPDQNPARNWYEAFKGKVIIPTADGGGYVSNTDQLADTVIRYANRVRGTEWKRPPRHYSQFLDGEVTLRLETFIKPSDLKNEGYGIQASPGVYPGQKIKVDLMMLAPSKIQFVARAYRGDGEIVERRLPIRNFGKIRKDTGPPVDLEEAEIEFDLPGSRPIFEIGLDITDAIDHWPFQHLIVSHATFRPQGVPNCTFERPADGGTLWLRQWVNGLSILRDWDGMDCIQNEGTGLAIIGCREWQNYRASAKITFEAAKQSGLAVHVQGMRRFYALVLEPGKLKFIKSRDGIHELAEVALDWAFDETHELAIEVQTLEREVHLTGYIDGRKVMNITDSHKPLVEGAIGIVLTEGRARVPSVSIRPPS